MVKDKIRVFIVDDQALVLDILAKGLAVDPSLLVVGTATDGQLALNLINRYNPDVIVLDLEMPRMNGLQFLHHLMPVNPIPTIVLSALTFNDSKLTQQAFDLGAVDFLAKPSAGARALPVLINQLMTKIKIAATQDVTFIKKYPRTPTLPSSELDRQAKINQSVLGMGELEVTSQQGKVLKIFALGSCVSIFLYTPNADIIALDHVALPTSTTDKMKSSAVPGYFADSGIEAMVNKFTQLGIAPSRLTAKIAGGAKTSVDLNDYFDIGQRNSVSVKANLLKRGIRIASEDLGKNYSRTARVTVGDSNLYLHHPDKGEWKI